jgi:DNA-directed RNA polymerase subunit RPC12/RpoP
LVANLVRIMRPGLFDAHPSSDVILDRRSGDRLAARSGREYDPSMPRLVCQTCGRQVYSVEVLEAMRPEERRCPRCGALFNLDRREGRRRATNRRENPPDDPGPPGGVERRVEDRRADRVRRSSEGRASTRRSSDGWQD